jgi:hypothetical protein
MKKMPQARSELIVKECGEEILIYDEESNKVHCLNSTAAKVWKCCDGQTTLSHARDAVSHDLGTRVDEKLIVYAVAQFSRTHLLEKQSPPPAFMIAGMNRRQMVRRLGRLGLTAIVVVPLVTSIVAPTAVAAASCGALGATCGNPGNLPCCFGLGCNPFHTCI